MCAAAQTTLGASGVGVCVADNNFRVPLGSSTSDAATAEKLQFSLGEGPCLAALAARTVIRVDEDQIRDEWPIYHADLTDQTPYRSVVSAPITIGAKAAGAIDVYYTDSAMPRYRTLTDAAIIAGQISDLIGNTNPRTLAEATDDLPTWLYGTQPRTRLRVWIAIGMLTVKLDVDGADALARLRAYCYANAVDIDVITEHLISGTLTATDLN